MCIKSASVIEPNVTEILFLGLTNDEEMQKICFVLFLFFCLVIVLGNLLIAVTILLSSRLNFPMYCFLGYLSFIDICYATVTAPKMIADILVEKKTIYFLGCKVQLFSGHFFGCTEAFILTVMAFDRYIAICKPLHYTTIMTKRICGQMVEASWIGRFVHSLEQTFIMSQLIFCGPNKIDHYFCDVYPLLKLACSDTYVVEVIVVANSGVIALICFIFLVVSYIIILVTLRSHSSEGHHKALSTCASHITVVILFFGPCTFTYIHAYLHTPSNVSEDKKVAVFYTAITPMPNSLIYTLRNKEMKNAMRKLWSRKVTSSEKMRM